MSILKVLRSASPLVKKVGEAYLTKLRLGELPKEKKHQLSFEFGKEMCELLNVSVKVIGEKPTTEPVLFVGNHISYIDIPLIMNATACAFVAKKEIAYWPVIGTGCRLIGVVFVDRSRSRNRPNYRNQVAERIKNDGDSVVIFPSGTTSLNEDVPWKMGAFKLAKEHGIKVQPFRMQYRPARLAAYIEQDTLVTHAYQLLKSDRRIHADIEFAPVQEIHDPHEAMIEIHKWCRGARTLPKFAENVGKKR